MKNEEYCLIGASICIAMAAFHLLNKDINSGLGWIVATVWATIAAFYASEK